MAGSGSALKRSWNYGIQSDTIVFAMTVTQPAISKKMSYFEAQPWQSHTALSLIPILRPPECCSGRGRARA